MEEMRVRKGLESCGETVLGLLSQKLVNDGFSGPSDSASFPLGCWEMEAEAVKKEVQLFQKRL